MPSSTTRTLGPDLVLTGRLGKNIDVLVVALSTSEDGLELVITDDISDDAIASELLDAFETVGATGKADELTRIPAPSGLAVNSVLAVGLGTSADIDDERIRRAAGTAARSLAGTDTVATTLSSLDLAAAAEGFFLGAYTFTEFKSQLSAPSPDAAPLGRVELLVTDPRARDTKAELARSVALAESVAIARDFVNTPPSHLYPEAFAARAKELGTAAGLKVEILDDKALEKGGYGGIHGVGKGSSRLPRLVRLTHAGGKRKSKKVALVGKGITFDTGGISIKPASGMENMTSDMAGAAAVIATVILAAKVDLELDVVATVPMAENMPSGTAQRPGDVLTQYGGITVEVINTDAEGRLVLADAMVRACEDDPDYLIDTATLTGAQVVALGNRTPGVMGTDEFRDRVAAISQAVGEDGWAMPMPKEIRHELDSKVADLANVTNNRAGGMLAAALFLKEFVADGVEWAHIDVAGPAYNTGGPFGYIGKGGTGVPVRTMFAVLEDIVEKG
ncbi:leucyl aminopeptidase [Rhodococcus sp. BP-252]|uniref:leucyl aminopeptidase n=1 Tax=unclassified Rhodococcus (in: high G+C Gram-positive bacteria) TaxID=192944 RepID=UPI001C9A40B8|nr:MULTISPECIES: leucyl aminopeptidase [unclassified Rhodococcus (in: high G+C Gram-positive bacteria)]MBY6411410.1 leucyl aminopeptidase [Rhodococcus sp. BP-320]MBY6416069.1 leucyl aminopeptidase [Rhodococcus sp. BP-321]MBY6420422.1 leucyl aminopeptidase [Rhodococcus sp. BP-324]MBY6426276.1 leucyl aminopeptidase [Rhodococcus sp. BP-323]MBY6431183.1 leucyl aminopeptidase [Rhodococcus sp. BP-322]